MKTKIQISKLFFLAAALLLCCQQTEAQGWASGLRNAVLNGAVHAIKNPPRPEPPPHPTPKPVPPKPEPPIQQGNPRPSPGSLKQEYKHVELHFVQPKPIIRPTFRKCQDSLSLSDHMYQMLSSSVQEKMSQRDKITLVDLEIALVDLMVVCHNCYQDFQEDRFLILFNEIQVLIQQQIIEKFSDQ